MTWRGEVDNAGVRLLGVPAVHSTDLRERDDASLREVLDGPWRGCVFHQRRLGPRPVVVDEVSRQDSPQVLIAEHDDVVETFAAD